MNEFSTFTHHHEPTTMNQTPTLTPEQLDVLAVALASPKVHTAATRLTEAARDELAMRDRRGREDGPIFRIMEAIMGGFDPAAVAEHLDSEAAEVEARHAAARDRLAALRVQLDARRVHLRRHDGHVSAIGRVLACEVARLEAGSAEAGNRRAREIHTLVVGGFHQHEAVKAVDYAEARAVALKLEALAAAGIAPEAAPPVLTDAQVSEQMRRQAAPLRADLERVHIFQRDPLRDVAGLPGWVFEAIEAGVVALYDDVKNLKLIPA